MEREDGEEGGEGREGREECREISREDVGGERGEDHTVKLHFMFINLNNRKLLDD